MQTEQADSDDVDQANERLMESQNEHAVNVMAVLGIHQALEPFAGQIDSLHHHGEVQQMINNEQSDDEAAHQHGARSVIRRRWLPARVLDRTGRAIFASQGSGRPNVEDNYRQQR